MYVKNASQRTESFAVDTESGKVLTHSKPYSVEIMLMDKGIAWSIRPAAKRYSETLFSPSKVLIARPKSKAIARETIAGYACEKFCETAKLGSGSIKITSWWSTKLDYVMKTVTVSSTGTTTVEFLKIQETQLSDSLFAVPKATSWRAASIVDRRSRASAASRCCAGNPRSIHPHPSAHVRTCERL